jgi:hypothetical protein
MHGAVVIATEDDGAASSRSEGGDLAPIGETFPLEKLHPRFELVFDIQLPVTSWRPEAAIDCARSGIARCPIPFAHPLALMFVLTAVGRSWGTRKTMTKALAHQSPRFRGLPVRFRSSASPVRFSESAKS